MCHIQIHFSQSLKIEMNVAIYDFWEKQFILMGVINVVYSVEILLHTTLCGTQISNEIYLIVV